MTDIVRVDALRFALEAIGHDITDEQAFAILERVDNSGGRAPAAAGGNTQDTDRFAVARRTGLITDADLEDIDAELSHQRGGGPPE